MNYIERASEIVLKSRLVIIKELISCYKRIEYLEGKEFYDGIISDYEKRKTNITLKTKEKDGRLR